MADDDQRDFTDRFNTTLSSADEQKFQGWMGDQSEKVGRDVSKDLYDYDLRGWWKNNQNVDMSDAHLTDTFKKPNHPTFSTGSQYHGAEGMQGGVWGKKPDGSWTFKPGSTNVYSRDELQNYFQRVEPKNQLILPDAPASPVENAPAQPAHSVQVAPGQPELTMVQKAFLEALDLAEKAGIGGTKLKLFNDVIQRGRTDTITEKDLTEEERGQFSKLVRAKAAESGAQSGKVDYPDYYKHAPGLDVNILGGFRYAIDSGNKVHIKDVYDFNMYHEGPPAEHNQFVQVLGAFANPRGLAAQIGRQVDPDTAGHGVPVEMTLE